MLCKSSDVKKKVSQNEYNYNTTCSCCITLVYVYNKLKKWSQLSGHSQFIKWKEVEGEDEDKKM
jgi:hypothetical protein